MNCPVCKNEMKQVKHYYECGECGHRYREYDGDIKN